MIRICNQTKISLCIITSFPHSGCALPAVGNLFKRHGRYWTDPSLCLWGESLTRGSVTKRLFLGAVTGAGTGSYCGQLVNNGWPGIGWYSLHFIRQRESTFGWSHANTIHESWSETGNNTVCYYQLLQIGCFIVFIYQAVVQGFVNISWFRVSFG